ncbi:Hypothetical protein UVM_LOCUS498 [uncultured virus]|nr:Hypothetical protein UVM_LOCUS498 [uncultured virus]
MGSSNGKHGRLCYSVPFVWWGDTSVEAMRGRARRKYPRARFAASLAKPDNPQHEQVRKRRARDPHTIHLVHDHARNVVAIWSNVVTDLR